MNHDKRIAADVLGYVIAVSLGFLLFPQIKKTYKHKHTLGLSVKTMLVNIWIGVLGVIYAVLIDEIPLLVGECVVTFFSIMLYSLYLYFRENTKKLRLTQNVIEL
jgi:uncharacterized protein with PQ loop repeat